MSDYAQSDFPRCKNGHLFQLETLSLERVMIRCSNCNVCINKDVKSYLSFLGNEKRNENIALSNNTSIPPKDIAKLNKKIEDYETFMQGSFFKLKEQIVKNLIRKINLIESIYEKTKTLNDNIISLFKEIIKKYEEYHKPSHASFLKDYINYEFQLLKYKGDKNNPDNVSDYFKNFSILNNKTYSLQSLKDLRSYKTTGEVISLCLLKNNSIAASFSDHSVQIIDLAILKPTITITDHRDTVSSIAELKENQIVTCSYDKSIRIWTITNNSAICAHLNNNAHNSKIIKVITLTNKRFSTCSDDGVIKIWSSERTYEILNVFRPSLSKITSFIQYNPHEYLIVASMKEIIKFNIRTQICESSNQNVSCLYRNSLLQIDKERVILGKTNVIYIVTVSTMEIEKQFSNEEIEYVLSFCLLNEHFAIFGCGTGKIGLYNRENNTIELKQTEHKNHITSLVTLDSNQFISGGLDNLLIQWKI